MKYRLKKEGIHLDSVNREIGNAAKATNIPKSELREFMQEITGELLPYEDINSSKQFMCDRTEGV